MSMTSIDLVSDSISNVPWRICLEYSLNLNGSWMVQEIGSPMRLSRPNDSLTDSLFFAGHDNWY